MEQLPKLTAALVSARMAVADTVYKAGRNTHQKYPYVGHEDVVRHARKALLEAGLTLEETSVEYVGVLTSVTSRGEAPVWRWRGSFVLSHTSGEWRSYTYESTTQPGDKAAFVASTSLDRTALMRVMQLAGTVEEDVDHDYQNAPQAPQAPAAPKAPQAPAAPSEPPDPDMPTPQEAADLLARGDEYTHEDMARFLLECDTRAALIRWMYGMLNKSPVSPSDKVVRTDALTGFSERCAKLNLNPSDVTAIARKVKAP